MSSPTKELNSTDTVEKFNEISGTMMVDMQERMIGMIVALSVPLFIILIVILLVQTMRLVYNHVGESKDIVEETDQSLNTVESIAHFLKGGRLANEVTDFKQVYIAYNNSLDISETDKNKVHTLVELVEESVNNAFLTLDDVYDNDVASNVLADMFREQVEPIKLHILDNYSYLLPDTALLPYKEEITEEHQLEMEELRSNIEKVVERG